MSTNEPQEHNKGRWGGNGLVLLTALLFVLLIVTTTLLIYSHYSPSSDNDDAATPAWTGGGGTPIPHPVAGQENCLACHNLYVRWPMPDDHAGRQLAECGECHSESGVMPMVVPHDPRFNEECTSCHAPDGWQYLSEETHGPSRDDLSCMMCHTVGTPAMPAPHSDATFEENQIHAADSDDTTRGCLQCHDFGAVVPMPQDHAGRHNATCAACHARPSVPPMDISHRPDDDCDRCHAPNEVGELPDTHEGRAVDTCWMCHDYFAGEVPRIHPLEHGKHGCWGCHAPEATAPMPQTHEGRRQPTCEVSVCHTEQYALPTPGKYTNEEWSIIEGIHTGWEGCFSGAGGGCHSWTDDPYYDPESQIPAIPSYTHDGRTEEICQVCHEWPQD